VDAPCPPSLSCITAVHCTDPLLDMRFVSRSYGKAEAHSQVRHDILLWYSCRSLPPRRFFPSFCGELGVEQERRICFKLNVHSFFILMVTFSVTLSFTLLASFFSLSPGRSSPQQHLLVVYTLPFRLSTVGRFLSFRGGPRGLFLWAHSPFANWASLRTRCTSCCPSFFFIE